MGLFQIQQTGELVQTVYRKLFTIQFLHAGYENPNEIFLPKGIRIVPDEPTKQLFIDHKINYRFYTNMLICFIECVPFNPPAAEPKVPFIPIAGDLNIRFLVLSSGDFAGNTYVAAAGSKHTYQFSNKTNNINGGFIFLTEPVASHITTNDYEPGTLVQDGGNLYTAIKPVLGADNIAISNAAFWQQLQPVEQVVNDADLKDTATVNPSSTCFAVIDLFKNGIGNNPYKLFDSNDQLFNPAPAFTIKFASRL